MTFRAPVAQLERALASGAKGRRFESFRACHDMSREKDFRVFGGYSSVGRALDCDSSRREFEPR